MSDSRVVSEDGDRWLLLRALARGWITYSTLVAIASKLASVRDTQQRQALLETVFAPEQLAALVSDHARLSGETLLQDNRLTQSDLRTEEKQAPPFQMEETGDRYQFGTLLGRGGMGEVFTARDKKTGRDVAIKTLRREWLADNVVTRRFITEAKVTAQLEHPGIIPVYDLGTLPNEALYYSMRIVSYHSLSSVLALKSPRVGWPLTKLCTTLIQVCRALSYAHSRGVIHRDIKPENILLGNFGEVYLADWGIAKVLHLSDLLPSAGFPVNHLGDGTQAGVLLGTIGYVAPEQFDTPQAIDGRADLFALGVVLYQVLTGRLPFEGATAIATLMAAKQSTPMSPTEVEPSCPQSLSELCMRALAKNPDDRPQSAEEIAGELEAWLEGAKEKKKRQERAEELAREASTAAKLQIALESESVELQRKATEVLATTRTWEMTDRKKSGWSLEDAARLKKRESARKFAHAVERYSQALAYDNQNARVRQEVAELYWRRAEQAATQHDEATQSYCEELVRTYDDAQTFAHKMHASAWLSLTSEPTNAEVVAYRYVERDRILQPEDPRRLGTTPIREAQLEAGSWLLVLRKPGFRDVRYPLLARRTEHNQSHVNLYTDDEIGKGMIYVPGGVVSLGGDPLAYDSLPLQSVEVGDIAIAEFPVTLDEYLEFIHALEREGSSFARKRLPQSSEWDEGPDCERNAEGKWVPRWSLLIEGTEGREYCPESQAGRIPAMDLDWFDAVAYCKWRSEQEGRLIRLPTEFEWEKAARGADGRAFPWSHHFEPTYCKMRDSRPGFPQLEPVGSFPTDESPYGVRDLGGGVRTWVCDVVAELTAEQALLEEESPPGPAREGTSMRVSRGGGWANSELLCRAANRVRYFAVSRFPNVGIRVTTALQR